MQKIPLDEKSWLEFDPSFLGKDQADEVFAHLLKDIDWRQTAMVANNGKTYELPRLQCWMSDPGVKAQLYQKEGAMSWSPQVDVIRKRLEILYGAKFDYVLLNRYRNGQDKIGFHRDDEAEEEGKKTIASVSVGSSRNFVVKHRKKKNIDQTLVLNHGSLVVMCGDTQLNWLHSIPEDPLVLDERINMTFRTS